MIEADVSESLMSIIASIGIIISSLMYSTVYLPKKKRKRENALRDPRAMRVYMLVTLYYT